MRMTRSGLQSPTPEQRRSREHRPEETSLYPLIEANLSAFLEHLRERDEPLPRFVVDEFKAYLRMPPANPTYRCARCFLILVSPH